MTSRAARWLRATLLVVPGLIASGCSGERSDAARPPLGIALSQEERAVWQPLPESRAGIPVLLYHGLGSPDAFADPADAAFAIAVPDFRRQLALLRAAGYRTVTLEQFRAFHAGEPVDLPSRPLLITFDDALASSLAADAALRELGWSAVMFVDAGAVERRAHGYVSWARLAAAQRSGHWEMQLHAGQGHRNVRYGPAPADSGPYYAYRTVGEGLRGWTRRVRGDLAWGEALLRAHIPGYRPLAFAPPYGNFGQLATNDRRIPRRLGRWLRDRYGILFVQEPARYARPGARVSPRLQITRRMAGGDIRAWLADSLPAPALEAAR